MRSLVATKFWDDIVNIHLFTDGSANTLVDFPDPLGRRGVQGRAVNPYAVTKAVGITQVEIVKTS
jgi:hypothetical protein